MNDTLLVRLKNRGKDAILEGVCERRRLIPVGGDVCNGLC